MGEERKRIPIDTGYLEAIGIATYCFARLEWQAVWCLEKIKPGYLSNLHKKTAGNIGSDFEAAIISHTDANLRAILLPLAQKFRALVLVRNGILHGKPGSNKAGEQRLFRDGSDWSIKGLQDAADDFAACEIRLNKVFYAELGGS